MRTFPSVCLHRFVICVNGDKRISDVRGNDGAWHMVCATWSGQGGRWGIYVDGQLGEGGDGLATGAIITGNFTHIVSR